MFKPVVSFMDVRRISRCSEVLQYCTVTSGCSYRCLGAVLALLSLASEIQVEAHLATVRYYCSFRDPI